MEAIMDIVDTEKRELRKKLLGMLLSLTKEEIKRRSGNVKDILSNLQIYRDAKTVMAFFPLKGEVDLLGMIRMALGIKRFCFPVMDAAIGKLRVFQVTDLERDFLPGPYGVMQPDVNRMMEVDVKDIDLVIVPGLAFDRKKNRLGRGRGFYDRFLRDLSPSVRTVGAGFDFQILESLPIHPSNDEKVGFVAGESSSF
jgi:5-formyltetrahydrofolate cyclo-ligase